MKLVNGPFMYLIEPFACVKLKKKRIKFILDSFDTNRKCMPHVLIYN